MFNFIFSQLQEISGFQNCLQLEKLYLYDNQICEINNLELQINIEVLWLNNNSITQIQVWRTNNDFVSVCLSYLFSIFTQSLLI